jgi:hypothetical protein
MDRVVIGMDPHKRSVMEMRTPAAGEHALVPLDESGEVVERLRRERLDCEVGHAWERTSDRGRSASGSSRCQGGVLAVAGEELGRRAELDDPTRLEDRDLIGAGDRGEPCDARSSATC